ncbi:MAG: Na+:solute symporter [Chitinophagaceae bacterium]|nr:Na+:solute symporter [Chitinophagaceae bacterium]
MHLSFADTLIILAYMLVVFVIGFWISQKASRGITSYFLGDNQLKWWMLGFSNSSGMFDVSGAAWMVSMLFIYGINVYWQQWAWPVWNQVFLMMFLSLWLRRSGVMTGAEWITFRFGEDKGARASHIITVCFAVIVAIAFIAYMTVGVGIFANAILPWDLSIQAGNLTLRSEQVYSVIIILATALYSVKGGMYSVVATEIMQYAIMIISCLLITYTAFSFVDTSLIRQFFPEGWDTLTVKTKVELDWQSKWPAINKVIDDSGFRSFALVFGMMAFKGIWASLAGPLPSYDMQRILSTRSPKEAVKMNAFTMLVLYFPLYLLVASILVLGIHYFSIEQMSTNGEPNLGALLGMVIARLPVGIKGLIIAGMLAAFMSTFSAFVNSGPAYIVNDIYKKYIRPDAPAKTYVRLSYLSSAVFVLIGLSIGLFMKKVENMFDIITGGLYAGFVVPNVLKWIWWRLNGWGYFAGMLTGTLASLFFIIYWKDISGGRHLVMSFPYNLALSLSASVIVSLITRKQDDASLRHFYQKTLPWGWWKPVFMKLKNTMPDFQPNRNFGIDMFNVCLGIVWQMTLIVMPIYLVIRQYSKAAFLFALFAIISIILKFTWYDRIKKSE